MVQNVFFQETLTQGTAVIALDHGGYRGRCYYSARIPHGLGEGDVHLSFALIDPDGYEEGPVEGEQLLFGDMDAFSESSYIPGIPAVKIGAILYPKQGVFQIGVCLKENTSCPQLKIAWRASRLEAKSRPAAILPEPVMEEEPLYQEADENAFYIANAPRVLRTGESFHFYLVMPKNGGTPVWTIREPFGGQITPEGVYTAPAIPGIFEIQASLNGQITSVYIMVRE